MSRRGMFWKLAVVLLAVLTISSCAWLLEFFAGMPLEGTWTGGMILNTGAEPEIELVLEKEDSTTATGTLLSFFVDYAEELPSWPVNIEAELDGEDVILVITNIKVDPVEDGVDVWTLTGTLDGDEMSGTLVVIIEEPGQPDSELFTGTFSLTRQ